MTECFTCSAPTSDYYSLKWDSEWAEKPLCDACATDLRGTGWINLETDTSKV